VIDTHHRRFLILATCVSHTSQAVFNISLTAYNINHIQFSIYRFIYRIFKHRLYTDFIHRLHTQIHTDCIHIFIHIKFHNRFHTQIHTDCNHCLGEDEAVEGDFQEFQDYEEF
jgi:hypothetical protein